MDDVSGEKVGFWIFSKENNMFILLIMNVKEE